MDSYTAALAIAFLAAAFYFIQHRYHKAAIIAVLTYMSIPTPDDIIWIGMLVPIFGILAPIAWYGFAWTSLAIAWKTL